MRPRQALASQTIDAIFICTGGGSLIAGVAAAVKQLMPNCKVRPRRTQRESAPQRTCAMQLRTPELLVRMPTIHPSTPSVMPYFL